MADLVVGAIQWAGRDRVVVQVQQSDILLELDPRERPVVDPDEPLEITIERQQHFTFPDQARDVEGVVHTKDTLLRFGKVRDPPAPILALSLKVNEAARVWKPVLVRTLGIVSAKRITGVFLTPARDRLALCTYYRAWLFAFAPTRTSTTA